MALRSQRGMRVAVCAAVLAAACASVIGPPEETPPEAPNARIFRFLPPAERDEIFPTPQAFVPRSWLDRIVCPLGDQPGWKRTARRGLVERYDIECPGRPAVAVELDSGSQAPPAPAPLRLVDPEGFAHYRDTVEALEKKDFDAALVALDAARRASPDELLYRRERIYVLYSLGRTPEAIVEADEVLEHGSDALAWKYRALAARDLGLRDEVMNSIEGILSSCPREHPLYAEAVCAKGMFLAAEEEPQADALMEEGCRLEHKPCCEALETRREARARAERAVEAARSLGVSLSQAPSRPVAPPALSVPEDAPDPQKKSDPKADRTP